jgi:hypothetical protein
MVSSQVTSSAEQLMQREAGEMEEEIQATMARLSAALDISDAQGISDQPFGQQQKSEPSTREMLMQEQKLLLEKRRNLLQEEQEILRLEMEMDDPACISGVLRVSDQAFGQQQASEPIYMPSLDHEPVRLGACAFTVCRVRPHMHASSVRACVRMHDSSVCSCLRVRCRFL